MHNSGNDPFRFEEKIRMSNKKRSMSEYLYDLKSCIAVEPDWHGEEIRFWVPVVRLAWSS